MIRYFSLFNFVLTILIGTVALCLVPSSPTPANSIDYSTTLSSSSAHLMKISEESSPTPARHSDDIVAALTIYLEARGESFAGKMAVAAVIRNRMAHKFHSDGTVRGTVLRAFQFEPWIGRSPEAVTFKASNRKMKESLLAWELVQDGRKVVDGAVLFYNPTLVKAPRWAHVHRKVAKIGEHEFFTSHRI